MNAEHVQGQMVKLLDGRVLVAGGLISSGSPVAVSSSEIYDLLINAWILASPLSQPRFAFEHVCLAMEGSSPWEVHTNMILLKIRVGTSPGRRHLS